MMQKYSHQQISEQKLTKVLIYANYSEKTDYGNWIFYKCSRLDGMFNRSFGSTFLHYVEACSEEESSHMLHDPYKSKMLNADRHC